MQLVMTLATSAKFSTLKVEHKGVLRTGKSPSNEIVWVRFGYTKLEIPQWDIHKSYQY